METLLVEIGAEEIPAGYIQPGLAGLSANLLKRLDKARIAHGDVSLFGTPRRLAIQVKDVALKQESLTKEIIGPPENIGFDENGNPTKAGKKFAEKVGIPVTKVTVKQTEKGKYLCATTQERGVATQTVLKDILRDVICEIPFPKSMKWADLNIEFARPIHYIMALFGDKVVSFKLENIKSNRYTRGHYFMKPAKVQLASPENYIEELRNAYVIADIKERRDIIENEISKTAKEHGGMVLPDPELLDIVTNLVEYPVPILGKFDNLFLELPSEILITAMREHQKYFAVIDENNNLMPYFIAVNNTKVKDTDLSANGHERVIRARLKDAQFFYNSDVKISLETRVEKLKRVLFQAKLGTMHEKIMRVQKLAEFIASAVKQDSEFVDMAKRAAFLCKADLVSQVVGEFPKLQGVMGRVYANVAGEHEEVAAAIEEHYLPTHSGGVLPKTLIGAILSISDKTDSICGCFSAGLVPTGASDPYALRRQGIGIIQIILDKQLSLSLNKIIEISLKQFTFKNNDELADTTSKIYIFLRDRMAHLLAEQGFSKDVIASVVSISADCIPDVWNRVKALQELKAAPDFEPLAIAFKRVVNIIKKAEISESGQVDSKLFENKCESGLLAKCIEVEEKVSEHIKNKESYKALLDIALLKEPVDTFFDQVMVMARDPKIRTNRLALLNRIASLFAKFADFSKIST